MPDDPADTMRQWARAALGTAAVNEAKRDPYGAQLATTRSKVYSDAADLVDAHEDPADAVAVMVERAGLLAVPTPPLINFEPAGLRYVAARAWTLCAQTLDPDATVAQKPWP